MPLYDRECKACRRVFEVLESAEGYTPCSCGGETKRLIPTSVGVTGFALDNRVMDDLRDPGKRQELDRHRRFMNSPETKAKIKSGEWQYNDRGPSWMKPDLSS